MINRNTSETWKKRRRNFRRSKSDARSGKFEMSSVILVEEHKKAGILTARTQWRDYLAKVKDRHEYQDVGGQHLWFHA
ncbi:hypothetical protein R1flu_023927 [Riccia fluitans]|uniref:Uncharacterized protein n=1 Tax=Riccia fluitans TaxID=41844 RepID=A0ABD1XTW4_9MARC